MGFRLICRRYRVWYTNPGVIWLQNFETKKRLHVADSLLLEGHRLLESKALRRTHAQTILVWPKKLQMNCPCFCHISSKIKLWVVREHVNMSHRVISWRQWGAPQRTQQNRRLRPPPKKIRPCHLWLLFFGPCQLRNPIFWRLVTTCHHALVMMWGNDLRFWLRRLQHQKW